MKIDKRLVFEEKYEDENLGTVTCYFVGDKTLLKDLTGDKYPEGDGVTVSIECPLNEMEAKNASVMLSPYHSFDDTVEDYDWCDIFLPYEEIEVLLNMAHSKESKEE